MMMNRSHILRASVAAVGMLGMVLALGCIRLGDIDDFLDDLERIEFRIFEQVNVIQQEDPRDIVLPPTLNQTVIIDNSVTVINNIPQQIIVEELPNITIIGFENLTGFDGYYQYLADGVLQGVYVFDGEALLLEYPCLVEIELLSEDYFDPFDGAFIEGFDLFDAVFFNPFDFECGDAFIFTFDDFGIAVETTPIPLLP